MPLRPPRPIEPTIALLAALLTAFCAALLLPVPGWACDAHLDREDAPRAEPAPPDQAQPGQIRRIVAVGDVHGAHQELRNLLFATDLVDRHGHWTGGDATLVQTGDLLDRGADSVGVAHWLMELQDEARQAGGEVVVLLGNHEILNVMNDWRYVTPEMLEPFLDERSQWRLLEVCRERGAILRRRAQVLGGAAPSRREARDACLAEVPPGMPEYAAALAPQAPLGAWLRSLPTTVRRDGVVFVHGGISPALAELGLAEIDQRVRAEIASFDRLRAWLLTAGFLSPVDSVTEIYRTTRSLAALEDAASRFENFPAADVERLLEPEELLLLRPDGPFWFRGYSRWPEEEGNAAITRILAALDVNRIVAGHTPQKNHRILPRFDDRVFLIDTGMLAEHYEGVPAALEILDGSFKARYLDREEWLD